MTQALDVDAVEAHPGEHVHATAWAPAPVQLKPATHATQDPLLPAHAVVVIDDDEYPALQVHVAGCAEPPAHTLPASQPVVEQVADVVTQALDVGTVEAHPGEQVHAAAWAPLPVQLKPAPHARHVLLPPEHADVAVEVDANPALHVHGAGCDEPPAQTNPALQPVVPQVEEVVTHAADDKDVDAYPTEHVQATWAAAAPAQEFPAPHMVQPPPVPAQPVTTPAGE